MDQRIEINLIESAKQNVANKTTSLGDKEHKVEISKYTSQSRFEQEIEMIFNRLPDAILHSSQLTEVNSYLSVDTTLGSLIVSRDETGTAHVFRNSCRHRGAQLVEGKQCKKRIVCPYHAWSYTTDGKLNSVPAQEHCFPTLQKNENGLIRIPSIEKYGFIWICPQASAQDDPEAILDEHLADMGSHYEWMKGDTLKVFKTFTKEWQGNWKLFGEGGLETYHFAFAHKQTIASHFYNNVAVIDQLGCHFRVMMPTRELEQGEPTSIHDCSHTLFSSLPGPIILVQKHHVDWIQFLPLAPNKTRLSIVSLIPESADLDDPVQVEHWEKNHQITVKTLKEDWLLGESIQSSLEEGALPYLQFGKNEWALKAYEDVIERAIKK